VQCAEALRVQAYFDSQLDATGAHELEKHLAHCAECRELLNDLKELRSVLRRDVSIERAPANLRGRVLEMLDQEDGRHARAPRRSVWRLPAFWGGALSGLASATVAAAFAYFLVLPASGDALVAELTKAHLRSLQPGHLISVVSTDRHTVKPWLAGRADVAPAVADFAAEGFQLLGGRVEPLEGQRAAVTVYQHGAGRTISARSSKGPRATATTSLSGKSATCSTAPYRTRPGTSWGAWCGCCASWRYATSIPGNNSARTEVFSASGLN
jgi:anti-sigma factor RsiW